MSSHDARLAKLADLPGIATSYIDAAGSRVETPLQARRAVLRGLGIEVDTEARAREALACFERRRASPLLPFCVVSTGLTARVPWFGQEVPDTIDSVLTDETGGARAGRGRIQSDRSGRHLVLPALPTGYWQLRVASGATACESLLISAPPRCYEPTSVTGGAERWGVTAQVYSLRSPDNFGIGGYGDLSDLAEGAAELGADFLGLNPVHALFTADLTKISPYSPSSRRFLDAQLLEPSRIPRVAESGAPALWGEAEAQASIAALRDAVLVDRAGSWRAKLPLLESVWRAGDRDFAEFQAAAGKDLVMHATFEALSEHFAAAGASSVGEWPDAFRDAESEAVDQFTTSHRDRIDFHAWLQWQADRQLGDAHHAARKAGMGIGLFRDLADEGRAGRRHGGMALAAPPPRATYRLQFHAGFTFDDAIPILPYLDRLGISHVYASPIQKARPGSTHGYDIVDHAEINPELGGMDGFLRFSDALKRHGLGLLLDIVPNHMGIGGEDNAWWLSVIEWGRLSPHAIAFDIDWDRLGADGKLILPFLAKRYGEALEEGELGLTFDAEQGGFSIRHFEHRFPVNPLTYPIVLDRILMAVDVSEPSFREVLAISARLRFLFESERSIAPEALIEECEALKRRLSAAFTVSDALGQAVARALELINGTCGIEESFDTLHRLLELQSYRLAYWRVAASEINYRRFFDINTLAGVRVEEPAVFDRTHGLILDLVAAGRVQGLRIDHIDGLADPEGYLGAVQARVGPGFYVVAEKILGHGERLRGWPMSGTTGYDVLNLLDGALVDQSAATAIEEAYAQAAGPQQAYGDALRGAKREVLEGSFASELEVVASDLARIAACDRRTRDYTINAMRRALTEIIVEFPVYRSYVGIEASPDDRELIEETVAASVARSALPDHTVHAFIAETLLGDRQAKGDSLLADHIGRFRRRFQQLTGPVTAKSVEDTLFYRRVPLLALNEVGGEPCAFGFSAEAFHAANIKRQKSWPNAMIATATHDTKRGEDARARLLALSEMPSEWTQAANDWQSISSKRGSAAGPDPNDRHLILQQLLAAWPMELLDQDDQDELDAFRDRMQGWAEKALREAKRHTSWTNPRIEYEAAAKELIGAALAPGSPFLQRFRALAQEMASRGMVKSLARTVLKLTLPGVPDFYQGTEFWDLSLVDPDNRRPVDYAGAQSAIAESGDVGDLMATWRDGRVKQRIVQALLTDRREVPRLYAEGVYRPLVIQGHAENTVLAFERRHGPQRLVVIVMRLGGGRFDEAQAHRAQLIATLPMLEGSWRDVLSGNERKFHRQGATLGEALGELPVAVLRG